MRTAAFICVLIAAAIATPAFARQAPPSADTELALGREALAKDPAAAIAHFQRVDSRAGHEWLAVALMMESRSASDDYVERAFASAIASRIDGAAPARAAIASALQPGDLVIASLVGDSDAYAWTFDREAFVGYQLPPRATLETAIERARTYADAHDRDGLQRIADDLVPALLGPAAERLPKAKRLILALDPPLAGLPPDTLSGSVPRGVAVVVTTHAGLMDAIHAPTPAPRRPEYQTAGIVALVIAVLAIAFYVSRRARRRSHAPS